MIRNIYNVDRLTSESGTIATILTEIVGDLSAKGTLIKFLNMFLFIEKITFKYLTTLASFFVGNKKFLHDRINMVHLKLYESYTFSI